MLTSTWSLCSDEEWLTFRSVEIKSPCVSSWHVGKVDGQVGSILLLVIERLILHWSISLISGNLDDTVSLGGSVCLHDWSFELESLLVVDVVEQSVGGATLEAVFLVFG